MDVYYQKKKLEKLTEKEKAEYLAERKLNEELKYWRKYLLEKSLGKFSENWIV